MGTAASCLSTGAVAPNSVKSAYTDSSPDEADGCLLDAQHSRADVHDRYEIKQVIGRGSYASTHVCVERATGRHFACKAIVKEGLTGDERRRVRREVSVMYHLAGHPNIVRLVDAFEDEAHVFLIEELCSGGEMVERILSKGTYTERDAAGILRSILEAVAYAHDMGCMHRDIKVENCLLLDRSPDAPVKLVDWGYSSFLAPGLKLHKLCGTACYLAPEVIAGTYTERADVWSCGVVLYVMLAGRLPFNGGTQEEVMAIIKSDAKGVPDMSGEPWASVSAGAKAAVAAMMTRDPKQRPSARAMLQHEWVKECGAAGDEPLEPEVLHRVRAFASMNKLKKHAAMVIARHLPADQVLGLKLLFASIAPRGGGAGVGAAELRRALAARGAPAAGRAELEGLLALADLHGCGRLDCPEFVAAALPQVTLEQEANMQLAFKHFDQDGDGRISASELAAALAEDAGAPPSAAEVAGLVAAADEDGDGGIDFREFKHLMASDNGGAPGTCSAAAGAEIVRQSSDGFYDLY
ncbi:MAG: kinase-like domain-containing protein [Monoraphidium minutum]|nr:MAG: kinase-like domain-containing protein [Monoraphidium minutum]